MPSPGITKKMIANAIKQLMQVKSFDKITVSDIVDACSLNRNSFYYHFEDKYDLVNWIFYTEMLEEIGSEEAISLPSWELVERVCKCLYREQKFYAKAIRIEGSNSFKDYYHSLIKQLIEARLVDAFVEDEYHDFYVSFFADAFAAATMRWIEEGMKIPPETLARLIREAMTGAAFSSIREDG